MRAGAFGEPGANPPFASTPSEQLERGFRWLTFSPDLESAYRQEQFFADVGRLRLSLVVLGAAMLALFQIDHSVMPDIAGRTPAIARYGVMLPTLTIAFLLTYAPRADVWYPRAVSVLAPVTLIAIAWLGLWAWSQGEARLFVRLIVAMIAVYIMLGLPFRRAFIANVVVVAAYVAIAYSVAMPAPELVHYLCALLIASVICAMGAYSLEHARRTAWLEARMLAEHALHDGLTGIHNRRRFDEHLQRVWQQGRREHKPVSLLFADIDHFKKYNDRYGHQAGDEALKAVAAVLARHARRPFDIAARFGGEEFAVLLYDASSGDASRIAAEALQEVRALGRVHEDSPAGGLLTISIGVATAVPQANRSAAGLLQLADQALYAAKDGGRDQMRALAEEYDHIQTGYFHRRMLQGGRQGDGQ